MKKGKAKIRKLVLDVIKPLEPGVVEVAKEISKLRGIKGVNVSVLEIDKKVENVRITVVGDNIDFKKISDAIEKFGGAVHSVDEVAAGREMVEPAKTLED